MFPSSMSTQVGISQEAKLPTLFAKETTDTSPGHVMTGALFCPKGSIRKEHLEINVFQIIMVQSWEPVIERNIKNN